MWLCLSEGKHDFRHSQKAQMTAFVRNRASRKIRKEDRIVPGIHTSITFNLSHSAHARSTVPTLDTARTCSLVSASGTAIEMDCECSLPQLSVQYSAKLYKFATHNDPGRSLPDNPRPFCTLAYRIPSPRRSSHSALQLIACSPRWWKMHSSD